MKTLIPVCLPNPKPIMKKTKDRENRKRKTIKKGEERKRTARVTKRAQTNDGPTHLVPNPK